MLGETTYMVERFDLMFTVLVKATGELVTVTNTALMAAQLINVTRSPKKSDSIKIKVPTGMPLTVLKEVKEKLQLVSDQGDGDRMAVT